MDYHKKEHAVLPIGSNGAFFLSQGIAAYQIQDFTTAAQCFHRCLNEESLNGNDHSDISNTAMKYLSSCTQTDSTDYKKQATNRRSSMEGYTSSPQYASPAAEGITGIRTISDTAIFQSNSCILLVFNVYDFVDANHETFLSQVNNEIIQPLGFATTIADGIFISTRHIFNYLRPSSFVLYSPVLKGFYAFQLIEDGGQLQNLDYLIGKLVPMFGRNEMPPFLKMAFPPGAFSQIALNPPAEAKPLIADYQPDQYKELQLITCFSTYPGFCGLPYIDPNGNMIALHSKRSDSPLMNGLGHKSIGVPLNFIAEASTALRITSGDTVSYIQNPDIVLTDDSFPEFSTALLPLEEVDEEGERESILGKTPSIKKNWSVAARKVLLRFFQKGKAEFRHKIVDAGNTYTFTIKYKKPDLNTLLCLFDSKNAPQHVRDTATNEFTDIPKLIDNKIYQSNWWVYVYKDKDSIAREFVQLVNPDGKNIIEMGHKIPAVCFWNYGADSDEVGKSYKNNRINDVINNKRGIGKPDRTPVKIKMKVEKIKADTRFTTFKNAGYLSWSQDNGNNTYIRKFMLDEDGTNYTFQTRSYNASKSGNEKVIYGEYSFKSPTGFFWKKLKGRVSASEGQLYNNRLVPTAENKDYFRSFDTLEQVFQIKLGDNWVGLTDYSKTLWPNVFKQTASTVLLSRIGTHLNVRIDPNNLTGAQVVLINKQQTKISKKISSGIHPEGFFYYSRKLQKRKDNPTLILNQCIDWLNDLDTQLSVK